ncbi:MAG TPA: hypothetical protein VKF14_06325, partial [Candidatus Dormibacteraeota bacterium]|nr:hypothetical protein [Candidatus Dormibacteraeota bacterium]
MTRRWGYTRLLVEVHPSPGYAGYSPDIPTPRSRLRGDPGVAGERAPAAGLYDRDEVLHKPVEQKRLLQVAGVTGPGHDGQRGRGDRPLEHQVGIQAGIVGVAGDNECGYGQSLQLRRQVVEGGPAHL